MHQPRSSSANKFVFSNTLLWYGALCSWAAAGPCPGGPGGVACHPESSAAAAPPHGTRLSSPPLLHSWSPARFIIATTLKYIRFGTSLLAPASFPGELFRVKGAVYSKYDTHSSYHLILRFAPSLAHLIFLINMSYDYCMPARIAPALLVEERHSPKLCCYRVPSTTLTTHVHLPLHL